MTIKINPGITLGPGVTVKVPVTPPTLVSIAVTPTGAHLPMQFTTPMTATALFSDGSYSDYTDIVTWSSTGEAVATIDNTGLVTGVAPGTVNIRASYQAVAGIVALAITDDTLISIGITPSPAAVARGSTLQLIATGIFSDGSYLNITSQSTWASTNDRVATVDSNGLATGVSGGSSVIHATSHGIQGTLTLFAGN